MGNRAFCNLGFALPLTIAGFLGLTGNNSVFAQVIPDDTVGTTVTNDTVTREIFDGNVNVIRDLIRGGTISGNALFHSFEEFNVGELREVIFDLQGQGANIEAIFTRVTGENSSNIADVLGVLEDAASFTGSLRDLDDVDFGDETALGDVNLFLLNPNGISFGSGARFRLNGSFLATTADGFEFEDGSIFSASGREPAPPLLTISIPRFLSFRDNPGGITNRATRGGGLRVPGGLTFGLIGGEVQYLTGASRTADGRIEIGAVGSNERVTLIPTTRGYQVSYEGVETFENITIGRDDPENDTRRANLNVDGEGVGTIQLQGRNITLTNDSRIRSNSRGSATPGEIVINASERLTVENDSRIQTVVDSGDFVTSGEGASITINTRELLIQSGGWIDTRVRDNFVSQEQLGGQADGGDIIINATDFVRISGTIPGSNPSTDNSILSQALSNSVGNAGDIIINTGQFILEDGARVFTDTLGAGDSGDIVINAAELVQITGFNEDLGDDGSASIIFTQAQETATGNAGNITVNTPQLLVQDGAAISASNTGFGDGGNILLNVSDLLLLRNGSSISATSAGFGGGGNIAIDTQFVVAFPEENSDIIALGGFLEGGFPGGGGITINSTQIYGFQLLSLGELTPFSDIVADNFIEITFDVQASTPIEVIEFPEVVLQTPDVVTQSACYDFGGDSQLANTGRGGIPPIPGLVTRNDVVHVDLVDEVLLPPPPPEAIKPHHRTDVTFLDSEGEEFKPAMGAVLLPNGMVEFVDYNPAEVYRDMYAAAGCNRLSKE